MLKRILDPHSVVVQMLPTNVKDLAIISQSAHVQVFDNVRDLSHSLADALCVNATGGYLSNRKLYTDDAQSVLHLHGAVVLNSIHDFVSQPDLAQRCLLLQTVPLSGDDRRSEAQVFADFEADLPEIMRGLFDLIAQVFVHLPSAKVVHPERMIEFVRWLAAMEVVEGAPAGAFPGRLQRDGHARATGHAAEPSARRGGFGVRRGNRAQLVGNAVRAARRPERTHHARDSAVTGMASERHRTFEEINPSASSASRARHSPGLSPREASPNHDHKE